MGSGNDRSSWRRCSRRAACCLALCLTLPVGCAFTKQHMDQALMAEQGGQHRSQGVAESYLLASPDVLEVHLDGRPDLGGRKAIGIDGRIELGAERVRVEGLPAAGAAGAVAEELRLRPEQVRVRVVEYNSKQIYLFGEIKGHQRAVPYQGPETVLDLLQRVGGVTPGAQPGEVHVLRAHVTDGKQPEVFQVDLESIVRKNDHRTNLRLQPFDQVHVGETIRSSYEKCVPPCLRPIYEKLCGLSRS
jgi:protein involved in polysaccharide export with SLBB domain